MLGIIQFQIILWFFSCLCRFRPPTSVWRNVIFRQNLLSIDWTQLNQFNHSILVLIRASWTFISARKWNGFYDIHNNTYHWMLWILTKYNQRISSVLPLFFPPTLSHTYSFYTFCDNSTIKTFFLQFFLRIIFIWQEVDEILLTINFGNRRRSIPINFYLISRLVSIIIKIIVSVFHFFPAILNEKHKSTIYQFIHIYVSSWSISD